MAARQQATPAGRRHFAGLAALALLLLLPAASRTHTLLHPRLAQLRFGPELLEAGVQSGVHSGTRALELRRRFDADGDGALAEPEQQALAAHLDGEARADLVVRIDGVPLAPETGPLDLQLDVDATVEAGEGFAMRSSAAVAMVLLPGPHRVEVADVPIAPRVLLPLRIDLPAGWSIEPEKPEGEAVPLRRLPDGAWIAGFLGEGGAVRFRLLVPDRERTEPGPAR